MSMLEDAMIRNWIEGWKEELKKYVHGDKNEAKENDKPLCLAKAINI